MRRGRRSNTDSGQKMKKTTYRKKCSAVYSLQSAVCVFTRPPKYDFRKALKQSKKAENDVSRISPKFSCWVPVLRKQYLKGVEHTQTKRPTANLDSPSFEYCSRLRHTLDALKTGLNYTSLKSSLQKCNSTYNTMHFSL